MITDHSFILIVDYGSQYTQLIARRVRSLQVYSEVIAASNVQKFLETQKPSGIILSGGPQTIDDIKRHPELKKIFSLSVPILGVCYGMQLMACYFGGEIASLERAEYGHAEINIEETSKLFAGLVEDTHQFSHSNLQVWMSHRDTVTVLPHDFQVTAKSLDGHIVAIHHQSQPWFGLQFHPEVAHTLQGMHLLENFVLSICLCEKNWQAQSIIEQSVLDIQAQVGDEQVILALSGGVDSSVTAALLARAIGQQLTCVFINNGLLRLEDMRVKETLSEQLNCHVIIVDAREKFLHALEHVVEPEQKRKIIGRLFIECFDEEAKKLSGIKFLAQGTIYPDVIESGGSSEAEVIKSHHNVGGLPEDLPFKLIEPLRALFKDEVREVGSRLGLPEVLIRRHPFPGPGLAVRVIGELTEENLEITRLADEIFIQALHESGWYQKLSQAFACFLPIKSVGVQGDKRSYGHVIVLRAVTTDDFMTAHCSELPLELLKSVSTQITNKIPQVNRVVYDISNKPPATIEWE